MGQKPISIDWLKEENALILKRLPNCDLNIFANSITYATNTSSARFFTDVYKLMREKLHVAHLSRSFSEQMKYSVAKSRRCCKSHKCRKSRNS